MFERLVQNIADILMALTALMADDIRLFLTHIHFLFKFPGASHKLPNGNESDFLNLKMLSMERLESSY